MSEPLMIWLIGMFANLGGMLVIYSFMAFCLARLHWHGRGVLAVLVTIVLAGLFWVAAAMIGFVGTSASYSLCYGNCLVSAFAIVFFCQTVKEIPRQLEDSARLDGCGWFGTYWHAVLPLVRRDLGFIALLIVMATALPFWALLTTPDGIEPFFEFVLVGTYYSVTTLLPVSVITSLPVIAIFFVTKRQLRHTTEAGRTGSVSTL